MDTPDDQRPKPPAGADAALRTFEQHLTHVLAADGTRAGMQTMPAELDGIASVCFGISAWPADHDS